LGSSYKRRSRHARLGVRFLIRISSLIEHLVLTDDGCIKRPPVMVRNWLDGRYVKILKECVTRNGVTVEEVQVPIEGIAPDGIINHEAVQP
jgi:hypothetical protein